MSAAQVPAIAVHGGAKAVPTKFPVAEVEGVKRAALEGYRILSARGSALEAVEAAVHVLEDDPTFNAGKGSVLTSTGEVEMDALIMDGRNLNAGAVGCIRNIQHPITVARLVMEKTPHVVLVGPGANEFAAECGIPTVPMESLITDFASERCRKVMERRRAEKTGGENTDKEKYDMGHDTVGAVAVDRHGNVASATSTGGTVAKMPGRVGGTPILGAGGYADNKLGAVSATGHGEGIIRLCLGKTILDRTHNGTPLQQAAEGALVEMTERVGSRAGAIVVTPKGEVTCSFNSCEMSRAWVRGDEIHFGIYPEEDEAMTVAEASA